MPCFKGIAVSIHANSAPLPEYGMQKQSRLSRISTYIPVPQPQLAESNKPEPAKFAISITLLTPGLPIPYSTPKPSDDNPYPKPQFVGGLNTGDRNKSSGVVNPYIPMTNSENETIAAYIYFDGRAKEEVATLLRPGEETWVNSRWVQVPDSEGGGLAEREFLFREVGLERWLNGLDLQGHDAAEKLEKRRQKFEKRRRRQRAMEGNASTDVEQGSTGRRDTLRYGADDKSPIEPVVDDSDSWSDDDDEPPEATGQIKVAMFRVLASGEIKKGEYSPQFGAHDGDEDDMGSKEGNGIDADVEHTTSFAKPKTLDPKTISTQTVTGIDGPDKPYAVFTFFYRGERQLQKIGVLQSSKNPQTTPGSAKRRSGQLDFSSLGPLKAGGTVGFSAFRDQATEASRRRKARKKSNGNIADDSDDDDEVDDENLGKMEEMYAKDVNAKLAPEDVKFQGELAEGVDRIHLKRAHSADPDSLATPELSQTPTAASESTSQVPTTGGSPANNLLSNAVGLDTSSKSIFQSPLKKYRPSVDYGTGGLNLSTGSGLKSEVDSAVSGGSGSGSGTPSNIETQKPKVEDEEEL
ncbi:beta-lactamase-type transpeptidase fold domain protein [Fusarium tjaetaba]|uniref:Beta-lactamase-type transpeptidase fold domain protein n=1 Tax=Fusarium tjaetaba TaxID=1567544 RepID=A0A8H5W2C8_9HYPO|nr:beta-lactamase-type transpeptidase fold domain protein [Fusarium tjaetaba]KAF5644311.1 beta-lactamase-type transpeptidase fold domain protein [Fusarium tjaetaba]